MFLATKKPLAWRGVAKGRVEDKIQKKDRESEGNEHLTNTIKISEPLGDDKEVFGYFNNQIAAEGIRDKEPAGKYLPADKNNRRFIDPYYVPTH